jgi:hypothetical protein
VGTDLDPVMAGQALFAYRVQLPDGSEAIRTGGAERAPTVGQLADYAANQGERFLGPVQMSPAVAPATPAATAAPPPAPPPPAPAPAAPAAEPAGVGASLARTFFPERSFTSELPSVGGGILAGAAVAPYAPGLTPLAAGAGSSAGELAQIGIEKVAGWPPAEPGTVTERMGRAYARGATGELATKPVRMAAQYAVGAVKPLLKATEALEPVLTREVPATATLVHAPAGLGGAVRALPIDEVLANPAALRGVSVTPEMQQTLLTRWWQTAAEGGPKNVVQAWDALGEQGQRALAGAHHGDMATVVESLRGAGGLPLLQMTPGQIARESLPGTALALAGHPLLGAGVTMGAEAARAAGPRLLLSPGPAGFLASLPQMGRVASPWASGALRATGQLGAATPATPYQ